MEEPIIGEVDWYSDAINTTLELEELLPYPTFKVRWQRMIK